VLLSGLMSSYSKWDTVIVRSAAALWCRYLNEVELGKVVSTADCYE
jgi:hypothetical protein